MIFLQQELSMDWIIHLDTDELLHPAGAQEYSLQRLLRDVAADVDMVVFPNYVSSSFPTQLYIFLFCTWTSDKDW